MIKKRNLLCFLQKDKLDLGQLLLYEPYKNLLLNFKELCINKQAREFDPISKVFDGLLSVPSVIKEYYEALLSVTSYYQHSKGGKGKYIEKKIASAYETCSLNIELSKLPFLLEYPLLHKKKGIFTYQNLSAEEKQKIRTINWDWIGEKDLTTDVASIIKNEKSLVLVELKNRIDSGGTAGRREIWSSEKFGLIIEYLISDYKLFRKDKLEFDLKELLNYFDIRKFEIYLGILFDTRKMPATMNSDKQHGFYSTNKVEIQQLAKLISNSKKSEIISADVENLLLEFVVKKTNLKVSIGAIYGDEITYKLFRQEYPLSD